MLTAAQIVAYALQIVKAPGYTTQAGDFLNARLAALARRYEFDILRKTATVNVVPGVQSYALPLDYIRGKQVLYYIGGLPQNLTQMSLSDYNAANLGNTAMAYPRGWSSDPAQSPPMLYLYPMPNVSFPLTVDYMSQPPDIVTPATSSAIPWLPDPEFLITALAADLCKITDDSRAQALNAQAAAELQAFLKTQGDKEGYAERVKLGASFTSGRKLPASKLTGF
jgi:hypothetical protein